MSHSIPFLFPSNRARRSTKTFDSTNVLMMRRPYRLKVRAGIILSATDFGGEAECSFRESLGVANTGREWP